MGADCGRQGCVFCLSTAVELQFQALLEQTEREDSVPQAARHYLHEMAELTELAKERLDQVKVRRKGPCCESAKKLPRKRKCIYNKSANVKSTKPQLVTTKAEPGVDVAINGA